MPPTRAATPNVPQIKSVRLKRVDPVASRYQFRLGDGEVDLLKAVMIHRVTRLPRRRGPTEWLAHPGRALWQS